MTVPHLATIGYQGTTVAQLVTTLLEAGVRHLIDVRAVPLSRKPGFSKRQLAAELGRAGLHYSNLRGLGTPRAGRDAARRGDIATMRHIFERHMATDQAQSDLSLACTIAEQTTSCLLCFERDPQGCHRLPVALAIGRRIQHLFCPLTDAADLPRRTRARRL